MDAALIATTPAVLIPASIGDVETLVAAFLAGRNPRTLAAYRADLADFAAFVGVATVGQAASLLLGSGHGAANALALRYKNHLVERDLAAATVNRRLAALRSLVAMARTIGLVPWELEVQGARAQPYRDTRGPGTRGVDALLDVTDARSDAKGVRDAAIIALLFDMALRRGEVVALDRQHLDLDAGTLSVMGKGRTVRERLTLPPQTRDALARWLTMRGEEPGPLFTNFDPRGKTGAAGDRRLTGAGVYAIVKRLGEKARIGPVRPHGLRHAGVTAALDAAGGDVRRVQRFSRHRDLRTLLIYDDARRDDAGEVARLVAGSRRQRGMA